MGEGAKVKGGRETFPLRTSVVCSLDERSLKGVKVERGRGF